MQEKPVIGPINHGLRDAQLLTEELHLPCLCIDTLGNLLFEVTQEDLQELFAIGCCSSWSNNDTFC